MLNIRPADRKKALSAAQSLLSAQLIYMCFPAGQAGKQTIPLYQLGLMV